MVAPLPPPDPAARVDAANDAPPTPRPRPRRRPWVVPLVVAAGLLLAYTVGSSLFEGLTGDDDDDGGGGDGWDSIALVDEDGAVVVVDRDGEEVARIDSGLDDAIPRSLGRDVVGLSNDRQYAMVDISDEEVRTFELPDDDSDIFWALGDVPVPIVGSPNGADVQLFTDGGDLISIGEAAGWDEPLIVPAGVLSIDEGAVIAGTTIGDDEESFIADVEDGEVVTVPGTMISLDDGSVTTRVRGDDDLAVLERFDLDGESMGRVEVTPLLAGVLSVEGRDDLLAVTEEGAVLRLELDDDTGAREEIDQIDVDEQFDVRTRGFGAAPLLALGDERDDGLVLSFVGPDGSVTGPVELDGEYDRIDTGRGGEPCAVVSGEETAALVRVTDGDVLQTVDLDGRVVPNGSVDGCAVVLQGASSLLLTPERSITMAEEIQPGALSPDGAWLAVRVRAAEGAPSARAVPIEAITDDGTIEEGAGADLGQPLWIQFVAREE